MHVLVIGAGLSGISAAWYLRAAGHEVTVVERRDGPGLETSFANGGLVVPSQPDPWNAPGIVGKLIRYLGDEDSPFLLRPAAIPGMMGWGVRFLMNARREAWRRNTLAIVALAQDSLARLRDLRAATGLAYPFGAGGTIKIFRDPRQIAAQEAFARMLAPFGVPCRVLDRAATVALEPALAPIADQLAGAVHYPDDEYGDAHAFTAALATLGAAHGIAFRYGETVEAIEADARTFAALRTDRGRIAADALLVAGAAWTPQLLRRSGVRLWINPVKGYSASVPTDGWNGAPRIGVIDDGLKIAATPFGGVLRLAGTAEFAGWRPEMNERRARAVLAAGTRLLPGLSGQAERRGVRFWAGLRPVTPDGSPFVGETRIKGVYVNAGHGPLGWTLACGSGRLIADLMTGRRPDLDPTPFAPTRFS
jgi:D-amino-acid dehydrogenase